MKVSFAISVWEGNYNKVLLDGFLKEQLNIIDYNFCEKSIIINDVINIDSVKNICYSEFPDFNIRYTNDDYEEVLKHFELSKEAIINGYWYSIHHLNQFYHSNSDYNFYISGDCPLKIYDKNFIDNSIKIMESRDDIIISQPLWDKTGGAAKAESLFEIENFYTCLGFADHIYLAKNKIFNSKIYNYNHPISNRYPFYGRDSFERRVDSYMQTEKKYRIVDKNSYYVHGG